MKKWIVLGGIAAVLLSVALVMLTWGAGVYNSLVTNREQINQSWSQVENVLQRRYDLIPNLVATVKGYAKHEQSTLEDIAKYRTQWAGDRKSTRLNSSHS